MGKIHIDLPQDAWHGYAVETLWASPSGQGHFKLENSPFFATGLSLEDIVKVELCSDQKFIVGPLLRSGRSTYRIIPTPGLDPARFDQHWQPMQNAGCSYEHGDFGYQLYAVDVPPEANIDEVYAALQAGVTAEVWDFEEANFRHSPQ